jgi:predicted phage terminase large subunit-like protein
LYAQDPSPLGGGIIKSAWLKPWSYNAQRYCVLGDSGATFDPKRGLRFCTVDLAFTEKEIGEKKQDDPDYTVFAAWYAFSSGKGFPILVLLDLLRDRMEGPDILEKLKGFHEHWNFQVIGFESVAAQKALFQYAKKMQLPVREISTKKDPAALFTIDGDKLARVVAATPLMAMGHFYVPAYAPWLVEYIQEITRFPNAAHDDQADVTAYAVPIAQKLAKYVDIPSDAPEQPVMRPEDLHPPNDDGASERYNPMDDLRIRNPHRPF